MDKWIKIFLNKQFSQKILEHTVAKKELFIVFPHLVMCSLYLRTRLWKGINSKISFCKIKVIFKSLTRLANFFRFKDKIPLCLRSNFVYRFACGRCNATYYGETWRHFKFRVSGHSGIWSWTNKLYKSKKPTAVKDHMLMCNPPVSFDNFKVLDFSWHLISIYYLVIILFWIKIRHLCYDICLISYTNIS